MEDEEPEPLIPYQQYRTGETFATIAMALREEARMVFENEGRRMFVTRRTILGRWHQIKMASYNGYLRYRTEMGIYER